MIEITGNLFYQPMADAICITTNGIVRKDGACVMGRGCALEATKLFPGIDLTLGQRIKKAGNIVHFLGFHTIRPTSEKPFTTAVLSFPVKYHWGDDADLDLILDSCRQISRIASITELQKIVIPRPGCGNGRLDWQKIVKPAIEPLLDDRFYIISPGG